MKIFLTIFAVFVLCFIVRLWTLNWMGRTWDERTLAEKGYIQIMLIKNDSLTDPYWYEYPDHPPLANYFYGIASQFDLIGYDAKAVSMFYPSDKGVPIFSYDLTYTRSVSVVISSLTVLLVVLFGWRYISFFVGVTSGIILALLPYFLGLSQLVTYESFTAFFFTAGIFSFVEFIKSNKTKFLLLSGILGGLVLEVKQSNILFFPLVAILYLLNFYINKKPFLFKSVFKDFILFSAISVITYIVVWPMPWFHLSQFLSYTHNAWFSFSQSNTELFFGKVHHVPIFYYIVNLLVTIPVGVLFFLFLGISKSVKSKNLLLLFVFVWFAFPFVQSLYPFRQSGLRYIVEIYPPMCILMAIGINQIKAVKKKVLVLAVIVLYLLFILLRISPYYLDYFNELVGGAGTVYKYHLFDLGWWGEGEKEAAEYIKTHAPKGSMIGLALDPVHTMETFPQFTYATYSGTKKFDYVIVNYFATIRGGVDESPIKKKYKLVYTVYADGAELVHVYKKP